MPAPPDTVDDLLTRARSLAGRTLGEVAREAGVPLPAAPKRAKGYIGTLVERVLGATAQSKDVPDFEHLGVELKTIPVRRDGRPAESTFVTTIPLNDVAHTEWQDSRVCRKLERVLFVPIESEPAVAFADRRFGMPILWSPDGAELEALQADWDELAGLIGRGDIERVTGHLGQHLQVRPKARDGRERGRAPDADGAWLLTVPRGFYLRASFTESILRRALSE